MENNLIYYLLCLLNDPVIDEGSGCCRPRNSNCHIISIKPDSKHVVDVARDKEKTPRYNNGDFIGQASILPMLIIVI